MNSLVPEKDENIRSSRLQERQQQRFINKSRQIASKYLQKLNELPGAW